ncbi:hypothetical protein [Limoniibacter endophyticus]|uniref:Uncharacterized protein n=1 Tax=Limoniibacter endophyticus TaxID=1565040 RepID=A0A8J3GI97_9HYPH|nr:hypothetical protein [Limoniibacter endophyticus]GHC75652.1 hypothetical protein GCM10010136_25810 [Limoniibacter endophyticus]
MAGALFPFTVNQLVQGAEHAKIFAFSKGRYARSYPRDAPSIKVVLNIGDPVDVGAIEALPVNVVLLA